MVKKGIILENIEILTEHIENILCLETIENQPVFDPDFHTNLIIKDEYEDCNSGNMENYIL